MKLKLFKLQFHQLKVFAELFSKSDRGQGRVVLVADRSRRNNSCVQRRRNGEFSMSQTLERGKPTPDGVFLGLIQL